MFFALEMDGYFVVSVSRRSICSCCCKRAANAWLAALSLLLVVEVEGVVHLACECLVPSCVCLSMGQRWLVGLLVAVRQSIHGWVHLSGLVFTGLSRSMSV